jgi:signal transduction histidine kinase
MGRFGTNQSIIVILPLALLIPTANYALMVFMYFVNITMGLWVVHPCGDRSVYVIYLFLAFALWMHLRMIKGYHYRSLQRVKDDQKAHQARTQFVRYVFHEVRVPLNAMALSLDWLQDHVDDPEEARLTMDSIRNQVLSVTRLVNDVLTFNRLEDSELEQQRQPFAVRQLNAEIVLGHELTARKKNVKIEVNVDPAVHPCVIGDKYRIRQIIDNFVSNALKFTKNGSVVRLSWAPVHSTDRRAVTHASTHANTHAKKNKCFIKISVTDEGCGLTAEEVSFLFKPYSQIRPHELQGHGGSGLGLSIAKKLACLHAPTEYRDKCIGVDSEVGSGSTFWFVVELGTSRDSSCGKSFLL